MARLRVEFDGLTGLLPDRGAKEKKPPARFLSVLPDLRAGREGTKKGVSAYLAPHVPAVLVPAAAIVQQREKHPRMAFTCRRGPFAGREFALFRFEHELLSFAYAGKSRLDYDASNLASIPALADMKRPGAGILKDDLLRADRTPTRQDDGLIGTVMIDGGHLYVNDVIRDEGKEINFEFKPTFKANPDHKQHLFDRLLLDDETEDSRLELVFTRNSKRSPIRTVVLRPLDGWYDVWVLNLELETILSVGRPVAIETQTGDADFASFYLVSRITDYKNGPPVPHEPKVAGSFRRCKFGQFLGVG